MDEFALALLSIATALATLFADVFARRGHEARISALMKEIENDLKQMASRRR